MSFVSTGGITKLSQLTIDGDGAGGDKDWSLTGIKSIKELALAMVQGDLLVHDGVRIIRLPASIANQVLTSNGPGNIPTWQPGGLYLNRYFPASIYLTKALAVVAANKTVTRSAPITSVNVRTIGDLPASYVKELRPTITLPGTRTVVVANKTITKTPTIGRQFDLQIVVAGAFRSPAAVDTDETAAAQSVAVNDMSLPPQTPGLTDAYKFGHTKQFDVLRLNVGTAGVWVGTVIWEYWNGAWVALAGVVDGTNAFLNAGFNEVTFTRPGDWAVQNLGGLGNQYYIRARVNAYVSRATQPLGTQAFIRIIT